MKLDSRLITGFVTRLMRRVSLVEQELLTLPQHLSASPVFSGVRVTRSLVLYFFFCRSLFVPLYFFFWPLCCLFFFDIRILITLLVSSNTSFINEKHATDLIKTYISNDVRTTRFCDNLHQVHSKSNVGKPNN